MIRIKAERTAACQATCRLLCGVRDAGYAVINAACKSSNAVQLTLNGIAPAWLGLQLGYA